MGAPNPMQLVRGFRQIMATGTKLPIFYPLLRTPIWGLYYSIFAFIPALIGAHQDTFSAFIIVTSYFFVSGISVLIIDT
jgi:hypothetical protein